MKVILPGQIDKCLKRQYRGEIVSCEGHKRRIVAYVYGDDLEEMRNRKYKTVRTLRK